MIVFIKMRMCGVAIATAIAIAATLIAHQYSAPAMLFALLIGMAFHFLAKQERCNDGIDFSAQTLLHIGVACLGIRLSFSDMAVMGVSTIIAVVGVVFLTILLGMGLAKAMGKSWRLGLLTGGAVAICGVSAAMAIAAILPKKIASEKNVLFTIILVTALSTLAMVAYPVLASVLGFTDVQTGFLMGATIHNVAQAVGAGYSVSEGAGDIATYVKLQRVALLPIILLAIGFVSEREEGERITMPWFIIAFVILVAVNSTGIIPTFWQECIAEVSKWLLLISIAALGVQTSLKSMFSVGGKFAMIICIETLFILCIALGYIYLCM